MVFNVFYRTITVKNNKLTKIFQLPVSLGYLDFSDNNLETIPEVDTWPSMNALLSLDLSGNRLADNLSRGSFEYLLTLRTLNLQSNNITKPPWEALNTLSSLQYLYLQVHNEIKIQNSIIMFNTIYTIFLIFRTIT